MPKKKQPARAIITITQDGQGASVSVEFIPSLKARGKETIVSRFVFAALKGMTSLGEVESASATNAQGQTVVIR
jgi:hypothetical protein